MKYLILSVADQRHMPMIAPFIEFLNERNVSFDVIRSNRYIKRNEHVSVFHHDLGEVYEINMVFDISLKPWRKIIPFLSFHKYAIKIINRNSYDYIIVWNENTAALFSMFLNRHYSGRYCINIRDVYQDKIVINKLVVSSLRRAHFITVPSPEFPLMFPDKSICVYNRDVELAKKWTKRVSFREKGLPIRITHLGFYSKVKKAADDLAVTFGNDPRFELFFYGVGFDTDYKKIVDENGYTNIHTGGAFPYEKTIEYLKETDIINSYYNMFNQASLSISFGIKHSYTPMLELPGLADENTCWGRLSKPFNLAYLVNNDNLKTLPDDLFNWYSNLDFVEFSNHCKEFNEIIDKSQELLFAYLDSSLNL